MEDVEPHQRTPQKISQRPDSTDSCEAGFKFEFGDLCEEEKA